MLVCVVLQRQDLSGPSGSCRVSVSAMRRQKCTEALYSRGASAFSNHLHSVHANSIHERIPMTVFGGAKTHVVSRLERPSKSSNPSSIRCESDRIGKKEKTYGAAPHL